jgi:hypothetical protein
MTCGINKMRQFLLAPCGDFRGRPRATSKATMCPEIKQIRKLRSRPQDLADAHHQWPRRAMEGQQSKVGYGATDPPSLQASGFRFCVASA